MSRYIQEAADGTSIPHELFRTRCERDAAHRRMLQLFHRNRRLKMHLIAAWAVIATLFVIDVVYIVTNAFQTLR